MLRNSAKASVLVLLLYSLVFVIASTCSCNRQVNAQGNDTQQPAAPSQVIRAAVPSPPAVLYEGPPPLTLEPGGDVPGGESLTIPDIADGFSQQLVAEEWDTCGDHVLEDARIAGPTQLLAVSPTGEELWRLTEPEESWGSLPVVSDSGGLLICGRERNVYSISAAGELRWTYEAQHPVGWLFRDEEKLKGDDDETGAYRDALFEQASFWNDGMPSDLLVLPVSGGACVATPLEAVMLDDAGKVLWRMALPEFENAILMTDDSFTLYLLSELEDPELRELSNSMRKEASPEERRRLRQFNRVSLTAISLAGEQLWRYDFMTEPMQITPLVFENIQPCVLAAGQAYLFESELAISVVGSDGNLAWRYELPPPPPPGPESSIGASANWIYGMAVSPAGRLFVQTNYNAVFAVDADGSPVYESAAPEDCAGYPDSWASIMAALAADSQGNLYGLSPGRGDISVIWAMDSAGKLIWSRQLSSDYGPAGPVVSDDGMVLIELSTMEMNDSGRRRWGNCLQCYWPDGTLCYERTFRAHDYATFPPLYANGSHCFSLVYGKSGGQLMLLPETEAVWECDGEAEMVIPSSLVQLPSGALVFFTGDVEWVVSHCM